MFEHTNESPQLRRPGRASQRACSIVLFLLLLPIGAVRAEPIIVGWVERVRIMEADFDVRAKLDSGARHSSLSAVDLVEFDRDGKTWVRFWVRNWRDERVTIERPVLRTARIKTHSSDSQMRPVIELTLCVGSLARTVEVNLVDRENFNYPLLVGRSFLALGVLVDSARRYARPPICEPRQ